MLLNVTIFLYQLFGALVANIIPFALILGVFCLVVKMCKGAYRSVRK